MPIQSGTSLMLQLSDSTQTQASPEEAYEQCRHVTAKYAKTFYLGTLLMNSAKQRAIWAIYAWCRRSDELVDGHNAQVATSESLDRWEKQLEATFAGHPQDIYDLALWDTIVRFSLDIQPFRDMIAGQRMDLQTVRYETFDQLKLYCYRVAGTVGLMSLDVMGTDTGDGGAPWYQHQSQSPPVKEAIALGIANQLTNILRDVGEDARRGRIYLPLQELARFNYTEKDLMQGVIDDRWRALMQFQIQRAREYYAQAESGISRLSPDARFPVWAASMLYGQILNAIERNQYDVFSRRAYVSKPRKLLSLPVAYLRSQVLS